LATLTLQRPLAFIDIEATGTSPRGDRIVELAIVKLMPNGERRTRVFRVNPRMPIPPEAIAIHGITDADVADAPAFPAIANDVLALLADCDIGGYNIARYDIPMLEEEFLRAGLKFNTDDIRIVDAQRIYHRKEPRDLTAAVRFFCGEALENAHGAEADAVASLDVLLAELDRYPDLPTNVEGLDAYCNPRDPAWVDRIGRLKWQDGEIVLNFRRKKGLTLRRMIAEEPSFIRWMLRSDFPRDVKQILTDAMDGKWPDPPEQQTAGEEDSDAAQSELDL